MLDFLFKKSHGDKPWLFLLSRGRSFARLKLRRLCKDGKKNAVLLIRKRGLRKKTYRSEPLGRLRGREKFGDRDSLTNCALTVFAFKTKKMKNPKKDKKD